MNDENREPTVDEVIEDHLAELEAAYAEVGYFQRLARMVRGLGKPRASAEYKLARTELQRLAAPIVAVPPSSSTTAFANASKPG